jgi:hypothetical protein
VGITLVLALLVSLDGRQYSFALHWTVVVVPGANKEPEGGANQTLTLLQHELGTVAE